MTKKEERREICNTDRMLIRIVETATFLPKAHSLKFPGSDQLQNYWLKSLPAAHKTITSETGNVRVNVAL
jgi:hypothetical protein